MSATKYPPRDIHERTFEFARRVIRLVDRLPRKISAVEISGQLLRSGTSVGANVQEADAAESHKDFVHKIKIARKEAQEYHFWLKLINAEILKNDAEVLALIDEASQLSRILFVIAGGGKKSDG